MVDWMKTVNDECDGRLMYQGAKIRRALELCQHRRVCALDIGAHIGTWTYYLARHFIRVHAFEPVLLHLECLRRNVAGLSNVTTWRYALGDHDADGKKVRMERIGPSTGDTVIGGPAHGEGVMMATLDSLKRLLGDGIDLIKLDCEGYELMALRGGESILVEHKPVVVVEQKPGKASRFMLDDTAAVKYLESLGARVVDEMSGDYFMVWGLA